MPDVIDIAGVLYRALVPLSVRRSAIVARLRGRMPLAWLQTHNRIYDEAYYERTVEGPAARSAPTIAGSVIRVFGAGRVIDVGCGTGALLEELRNRGCDVFGLEYSEAALKYCRARGLSVAKFDLEKKSVFEEGRVFDVAVSLEVAEHLPEAAADGFVDLLTRLAPVVVLTAAPPGQGGTDHVNEQPPGYWIKKFEVRGFEHAKEMSKSWSGSWRATNVVQWWYYQNLMIFRRR